MLTSALAALLAVGAPSAPAPASKVQDWETVVTDDGAGSLTFRAMTFEENKGADTLVLSLDRLPGQCDQILVSLAVVGAEEHGLPGGLLSPNYLGEMQVDKRAPRRFDYRFLTDPSFDNVILVQLTHWDGDDNLFREVRNGSKWRFRFDMDGEVHSWRFSLMGVSTVLEQTYQACTAHNDPGSGEEVPAQAKLESKYRM